MSAPRMRTLVVGGAGFIGLHFVRLLSSEGRRQVVVAGRRALAPVDLPLGVQYVQADAGNDAALIPLLEDVDEVVDLAYATVPKTSFDDPVHDVLSNLPATVNLLQKASGQKLRRFLLVSSGGTVYGNAQRLPIDENHPTDPVSPYGITKLAAEKYALMFHRIAGLPVVIVRPSNPYGPNQFGNLAQGFIGAAMYAAIRHRTVTVFGERGTVRDYIHVEDLCRGMLGALEHGNPGDIYNIGTGIGYDNRSVLDVLSAVVNPDGYSVEVETRSSRAFDVSTNVLSTARLTYVSGWRATTALENGLRATWEWVRTQAS
jgi:UDP-glucose 4-epimerase